MNDKEKDWKKIKTITHTIFDCLIEANNFTNEEFITLVLNYIFEKMIDDGATLEEGKSVLENYFEMFKIMKEHHDNYLQS